MSIEDTKLVKKLNKKEKIIKNDKNKLGKWEPSQ